MATTRRPQINHRQCDHAATPKARKACRKAHRAAEQAGCLDKGSFAQRKTWVQVPNLFESKAGNTHTLAHLVDGTPVPACSRKVTKGQAIYSEHGPVCHRCTGVAAENVGRAR